LCAAPGGSQVFIAEGEKDADALAKLGLIATTNPGGAGKWRTEFNQHLVGMKVVVLRDNDPAGQKHADNVALALSDSAASVRIVRLPGLVQKGDVSDWLTSGGTAEKLRALAEHTPVLDQAAAQKGPASVWDEAIPLDAFLVGDDGETTWQVPRLTSPGCVTVLASPRGLGKTHLAYALAIAVATGGEFLGEKLKQGRVLLLDRDNPKSEIQRRLRAWRGLAHGGLMRVMTRDDVPALTDHAKWRDFPFIDYDLVILDSISAATEGVKERDGGDTGKAIAPLLDLARRGPAVLVLANTDKAGLKIRGSGVISDRADILYEVRDARSLTPTPKHEFWWEALPLGGEESWADKAKRGHKRKDLLLALVPSKFRISDQPDPWAVEMAFGELWTIREATAEVEARFANTAAAATAACSSNLTSYIEAVEQRLPITKGEAEEFLVGRGLGRNQARRFIDDRCNVNWRIVGGGRKGDPQTLVVLNLPAGIEERQSPTETGSSADSILAAIVPQGRRESKSVVSHAESDSTNR
jgi:hypothetical protein